MGEEKRRPARVSPDDVVPLTRATPSGQGTLLAQRAYSTSSSRAAKRPTLVHGIGRGNGLTCASIEKLAAAATRSSAPSASTKAEHRCLALGQGESGRSPGAQEDDEVVGDVQRDGVLVGAPHFAAGYPGSG